MRALPPADREGCEKQQVELMVYDISQGIASRFSPFLLGRTFEAIYHSGTLVFGKEESMKTIETCLRIDSV